jgi:predicted site-specific integrase-resolvase
MVFSKEAGRILGVSSRTLADYELRGGIVVQRDRSGRRLYTEADRGNSQLYGDPQDASCPQGRSR